MYTTAYTKLVEHGMVDALRRGTNLIHSDAEFRREYQLQFPVCSPLGLGDPATLLTGSLSAARSSDRVFVSLNEAQQRTRLLAAISTREKGLIALKEQETSTGGMRNFALRASVEETTLVLQAMREELAELDRRDPPERYLQQAASLRRFQQAEFTARRKAIQIRALQSALGSVTSEQRIAVERRIRLLQESRIEDTSLERMIPLPVVVGDDAIREVKRYRWLSWAVAALALILAALLIARLHLVRAR